MKNNKPQKWSGLTLNHLNNYFDELLKASPATFLYRRNKTHEQTDAETKLRKKFVKDQNQVQPESWCAAPLIIIKSTKKKKRYTNSKNHTTKNNTGNMYMKLTGNYYYTKWTTP